MSALPTFYDYKGYRLAVDTSHRSAHYGHVCVWSADLDLCYRATSLDKACAWVDAYRGGVQWAVSERIATGAK